MNDAVLTPTPNDCNLPRRRSDFATFNDAIDYAARSEKGLNFHDMRGNLARVYPYSEMRSDAIAMAYKLIASGIGKNERVALVAETSPEFSALFCACIYAGAWPVPLPLPTTFGGKESYIDQLKVQLESSDPRILLYPPEIAEMAKAAADKQGCEGESWDVFAQREGPECELPEAKPDDISYLQYSSGSTRFPTGVAVTHEALLHNLRGHAQSMDIGTNDRVVSWLPWYHDMGLVGCFLSLIANQVSVDLIRTEHFARRPLAWLDLISRNKGTTLSYSPTFGYDICARRISSQSHVADRFDLSRWRTAGNGADMIRPDVMQNFVNAFSDAGFKANAFTPSYGLAEATLAVTVMPPGEGIRVELVEEERLSGRPRDLKNPARYRAIVNCGKPIPGMEVEIRDEQGNAKGDHQIGKVWCRGKSVMHSYFRNQEATDECLVDGWLDTGDMGYLADGYLFIVGRAKDMIIINGKNHWPQDIEWAVEQLPGFNHGDIAAFSIETENGEEAPAVLVHCRVSEPEERIKLRDQISDKVRGVTGMSCVVELVPPRTLPRTSSGKLSRAKAKRLYLSGEIQPIELELAA
ncbi:fatty acyl-AMP ligase [Qipengyuania aquimaris]|uniref:fatty acyl-AMP ligase n=1 Tax=Qipengyuania aquimaris TaxID=255984 RepID=UPI001C94BA15|nr:fatty acyl-AMP ligase [Qipengyuania aquimaris]MBY6127809.1 fatty acyl-AMP ligase [Qipengyuania aquimaris]UOR15717.1 fatty acyl-AMP ligase [Qipengyuania aquimaris]